MKLRMIGCSHHRSGVAVRERLAFTPDQAALALEGWRVERPSNEAVLLSTCNRVEFYVASGEDDLPPCPRLMARHLADAHHVPVEEVHSELVSLRDEEVVDHLFHVAASLDSMVLGEPQILAQVKEAYDLAQKLGVAGPMTHGCFQSALRVGRRVASETALHRCRVSIPSVAIADFARRIFERFDDKRVLVVGAGEMADETLRYLTDHGAKHITIVNRDPLRAAQLASQWKGESASFSDLLDQAVRADMIISTTGAPQTVVTLEQFREKIAPRRRQRPLFILDLAMPRDFDPRIADEIGVYLYSIDDLRLACDANRSARERELPLAERIIDEEREKFFVDARHRISAPVIARLRSGLEEPKELELDRLFNKLPELDSDARDEVRRFADRLVNKMLHAPMESLRDESKSGSPRKLLDALSRLFQLKE
ncbi:Glutamyl-tRNA reductase [Posidoniimonas polymericola]|uniref:Glutamyl-tRNA reductase n=1 Tax=Posidoniimonas polymericola TaxID=2528002 RepID=A0A5C5YEX0_9BACT|nr:glutamyl-tRNA reductase [Posidoniimonas polymericola]TWT73489.1 Glutamyl-tRNA reductase [Posidoniimonas polymericola]